ncbi:MAG TPA: YigZ family protein [Bacteroidales bacterium]|nr:YigZ family protein [Bacteroidales bacterium]
MIDDSYRTLSSPAEGLYKEKGSRFISFAFPVTDQEEIRVIIEKIRKEHHDARHHCYAWMLGQDRLKWRVNDDGEPSGTGGKPILGQINSRNLTNIVIVVSRYFGGTLLGVSGLINAYKSAAFSCLENSEIVERHLHDFYQISFPYIVMNDVMKILKEENIGQSGQVFDINCSMMINFRVAAREKVLSRFSRIDNIGLNFIETK